jgi:NADH-quinone oxidoreductase subunit G
VPATGDSKPDFAITSMVAKQMGVILEGSAASVVFDILSHSVDAFAELNYARLAETHEQWPVVGRDDVYYGGTTYENTKGLGVQLIPSSQTEGTVRIPKVRKEAVLRPKDKELLAIPVNKLYDMGVMMGASAGLLEIRIGEATVSMESGTAKKLGVEAGQLANLSFDGSGGEARVKIDESIAEGVVLVPRSMGLAIHEPAVAKIVAASGKAK